MINDESARSEDFQDFLFNHNDVGTYDLSSVYRLL